MKTAWKTSLVMMTMLLTGIAMTSAQAQDENRQRGERGDRGERGQRQFDPEQAVERIMRLDENNDGKVSKEEIGEGPMQRIFERADADGDGFLTREELTTMFSQRRGGQQPGQRPGMGFQPGQVLPPFLADRLELTDDQREKLRALQEEVQEKLNAILTEEQREQLQEMSRRGPGGDRPQFRDGQRRGPRGDGDRGPRGPRGPRGDRGGNDGEL